MEDYTEINFLEEAVLSINKSYKVTLLMGQENCTGQSHKCISLLPRPFEWVHVHVSFCLTNDNSQAKDKIMLIYT